MSRIGNKIIPIPAGVTVSVKDSVVSVKGPKGTMTVSVNPGIAVEVKDGHVHVTRPDDLQQTKENHGTVRAHINNAITGVTTGFVKKLEIVGIGYRGVLRGADLVLSIGFSHEVVITPDAGAKIIVVDPTNVTIEGMDRQAVGQTAARIRMVREPEPYQGKGIKYKGEHIIRKEGKRAGKK